MVAAAAQGATFDGEMMTSYYRDDLLGLPEMGMVASQLWEASGLGPADISIAFLYDHFTPFVLMQLERAGILRTGEGKDFATVEDLSLGGRLPMNTSGGLLGEADIHGMNGIAEAVRQIRGTRQPGGASGARAGYGGNGSAEQRRHPRKVLNGRVTSTAVTLSALRKCSMSTGLDLFRRGGDGVRGAATWEGEGS